MKKIIVLLLFANMLIALTPQVDNTKFNLEKLITDIQKKYASNKSAKFSFEQTYKSPFLPSLDISKGEVFYKEKNMLWRYDEPKNRQKAFYIAGSKFTYHMISDKIAYTHDCFEQDALSISISFLWGKGNLKNSFVIKKLLTDIPNKDLRWLLLEPKDKNLNIESVALGIDAKEALVKESLVTDKSKGKNHFKFNNLVTNIDLKDDIFIFKPIPGIKVEAMPNVVCPPKPIIKPVINTPKGKK